MAVTFKNNNGGTQEGGQIASIQNLIPLNKSVSVNNYVNNGEEDDKIKVLAAINEQQTITYGGHAYFYFFLNPNDTLFCQTFNVCVSTYSFYNNIESSICKATILRKSDRTATANDFDIFLDISKNDISPNEIIFTLGTKHTESGLIYLKFEIFCGLRGGALIVTKNYNTKYDFNIYSPSDYFFIEGEETQISTTWTN